jgi:hypothetical protein
MSGFFLLSRANARECAGIYGGLWGRGFMAMMSAIAEDERERHGGVVPAPQSENLNGGQSALVSP